MVGMHFSDDVHCDIIHVYGGRSDGHIVPTDVQ